MTDYIYWGLIVVGAALLILGIKMFNDTQKLLQEGIKTTASVVKLIQKRNSDNDGYLYTPVFEFVDRKNTTRIFQSDVSSNPPAYKVGQKVKLVYHPKEEDEINIVSYWGLYRWTVILFSIASPFLVIGIGYLLYTRG